MRVECANTTVAGTVHLVIREACRLVGLSTVAVMVRRHGLELVEDPFTIATRFDSNEVPWD